MAKKKEKRKRKSKYERFSKVDKEGQTNEIRLKCRCLKCNKPMFKHHKSCRACSRKKRLKSKANSRGLNKNTYLNT